MDAPGEEISTPPAPDAVARRALVLSSLACRAHIDTSPDHPDARDVYTRLTDWLTTSDLLRSAEPEEARILTSPHGSLDQKVRIQASWSAEAVPVLAWALRRFDFPRHDRKVDPFDASDSIAFLSPKAGDAIASARLRQVDEIAACRELYYAIHSRLRDYRRNGGTKDFSGWVEQSWIDLLQLKSDVLIAKGDPAIAGRAIGESDPRSLEECEEIVYERHKAAIWLSGEQSPYARITVDT